MSNFDLYIRENNKEVYAIPGNLSELIKQDAKSLRKIGFLNSSLTSGSFPIVNSNPSRNFESLKENPNIVKMRDTLAELCDKHETSDLLQKFIDGLKYDGAIHSLDYIGRKTPIGDNIEVGYCRGLVHKDVPNLSIMSQFFIADESNHSAPKTLTKISKLREPYDFNKHFDVEVSDDVSTWSMHCYRVKGSVNSDYKISNSTGRIITSLLVAANINSLKIVEIEELGNFLNERRI